MPQALQPIFFEDQAGGITLTDHHGDLGAWGILSIWPVFEN